MKFEEYLLEDVLDIKYGKNQKKVKDDNGPYPILGTGGLMGYATEYLYDKPSVLIGRKGSISKVRYIDEPFWTVDTLFYTIVNEEIVYPKFIYYYLSQIDFNYYNEGTTIPSLRTQTLNQIILNLPDLKYQAKILKMVNPIEERIELNNSIISNLEELAQTLFKRWFVDFEFPNEEGKPYKSSGGKMVESELGMIPEGWKIKELNDISKEIICGKTPKTSVKEYYGGSLPFITIPDMHSQVFALNTARYLTEEGQKSQMKKTLPPNSICVSCIATPGLVMLTCVPSQTNQQINNVIPYEEDTYFLYLTLKNMSNLIKELGSGGSTTLNLNKTQFSKIKITYPIQGIREKFNEKIESLFSKILCLQKENQTLINMRDTILPKLLSGEIELPDDMEVTDDVPIS